MVKLSSKTLALVISAIKNMRESKGSSSRDILNYISSIYDIPQDMAKRQMVAALKRGVAHGILRKSDGYYSLPTDTEAECMEVAAQELGLLDLCCRRKKREQRRKKGCKKTSKRKKSRKSRSMKSCKKHHGKKKRRGKSGKRGCGCKSKSRRGKGHSRKASKKGCKPKRPKRSKCKSEEKSHEETTKCKLNWNGENYERDEIETAHDRRGVTRSRSKSRSCSRNRNLVSTV